MIIIKFTNISCVAPETLRANLLELWECTNYNVLNEPERNIEKSSGDYCDETGHHYTFTKWRGSGWYRILPPAGTRIPESHVGYSRCGTVGSGWIQGVRQLK